MVRFSILDLAFVPEGETPADALRKTLDLGNMLNRGDTTACGWQNITT